MSAPTTRRYPRTLAQAFPREHANPITHYRSTCRIRGVLLAVFIGVSMTLLTVYHL